MFAFLIAPQRFIFNPLARRDRHLLRQQHQSVPKPLRMLAYLSFIPFLILAFLPTQIYFTRPHLPFLLLMTASSIFLWVVVSVRTLAIASHLMAREQGLGQWEQLILTQMDARQIVLSKWISVLPSVWFWHVLVALTRLGIALGYAQLFHHDFSVWECPFGASMFCHTSHNLGNGYFPVVMYTDWWKIVLASGVLAGFALLEAMLISAVGILGALVARRSSLGRLSLGIAVRALLIVLGASFLFSSEHTRDIAHAVRSNPYNIEKKRCSGPCYDWFLLIETIDIGGMGLADDGTGIAINVMRPSGSRILVVRHLFAAAIGMTLFLIVIWLILRMAVWVAVRQRAMRPGYV